MNFKDSKSKTSYGSHEGNSDIENPLISIFKNHREDILTLSYSGGKDSTLLLLYATDILIKKPNILKKKLHIIYSDTGVEIPEVRKITLDMLDKVELNEELKDKVEVHRVRPSIEDNFFVKMIESGYSAPHTRFRWCSRVLKTKPINRAIENLKEKGNKVVKILGTRKEESTMRKLNRGAYEIGIEKSKRDIPIYAPLSDLSSKDVWALLDKFVNSHPLWEERDMDFLKKIYNISEDFASSQIRHGCWTCTVISPLRDDRALTTLAKTLNAPYLLEANKIKKEIWEICNNKKYRKKNPSRFGGFGGLNKWGKKKIIKLLFKIEKDPELKKLLYNFHSNPRLSKKLQDWFKEIN